FPRVQGPLWGLPQDAYSARTGLSETMAPGGISRLVLSDTIAFRAEFEGTPPASQVRYWRGPVLWDFDGRTWSAGGQSLGKFAPPGGGSATYRYSVVLEPHNQSWLFALEVPTSLPEDARYTADGIVLAAAPVRTRVRYEMSSAIAPRGAPEEQPRSSRARCAFRRASIPGRSRSPRSCGSPRAATTRSSPAPSPSCAGDATPIRWSLLSWGRTASTSSCSISRRASASTSRRRSCS